MSDWEVWGTQQSLTMKCPLVTWRHQKYFFFFFLYCAWLQAESLAHIFMAKELKSKPETKSEVLISQIESVQKDIETTFCNLPVHAVIKHNRPIYESCIILISIRPGIWWCFKRGVLRNKIYIRSGMFRSGPKLIRLYPDRAICPKSRHTAMSRSAYFDNYLPLFLIQVICA